MRADYDGLPEKLTTGVRDHSEGVSPDGTAAGFAETVGAGLAGADFGLAAFTTAADEDGFGLADGAATGGGGGAPTTENTLSVQSGGPASVA